MFESDILTNTQKDKLKKMKLTKNVLKLIKKNKLDYILDKTKMEMPASDLCKSYTPLFSCDSWEIFDRIGEESLYGDIYQACCKNDCNYVLKFIKFTGGTVNKDSIEKEIYYQKKFSELDLAPNVKESWFCESGGVIIMPGMRETLKNFIIREEDIDKIEDSIREALTLLFFLHKKGYYHGDSHLNNFMFDKNGKLYLIDMGNSGTLSENKNGIKDDNNILLNDIKYFIGDNDMSENKILNKKLKSYLALNPDKKDQGLIACNLLVTDRENLLTPEQKEIADAIRLTEEEKNEIKKYNDKILKLEDIYYYFLNNVN